MANSTLREAFRTKQDGIYNGIRSKHEELGKTLSIANGVDVAQGAYLVAWRHPEKIATGLEEISLAVSGVANALVYTKANLHTTLSDLGLSPNLVINPDENADQQEVLDLLVAAVKLGLDRADRHAVSDRQIVIGDNISDGKAVIATGQPSDGLLDVTHSVIEASRIAGVDNGKGLHGSWGVHSTINRFTQVTDLETARMVREFLDSTRGIGPSVPTALDVGHLTVNASGFTYTTYESFPLGHE